MPYAQVRDLEMYYEKLGVGEPIVFLHSHYSRGILAFASQLLDFQQGYTCYYPDHRGHGRTRCASLEWNTSVLADDVPAFMDAMGLDRAHILGYSCGANVALYCAVRYPERVATLTTIGTCGMAVPDGADAFEPETLIRKEQHGVIAQMIARHEEAHRGNWQEYMRQAANDWRLYPALTREELAGIACPAFLIAGEHDEFASPEQLAALSALVPGSRHLVVSGCDHRPHMSHEQPVLVNREILAFLREHPMPR